MRRASTVALAALLIACQPSTGPPPQATPPVSTYRPEAAGHKGGTLVLADWEVPDTLNPLTAPTENDLRVAAMLFAPLWNLDPKLTSYPDLVARVPSRENGGVKAGADGTTMTIDLHLKPGLEWSDGQPLTVDDVIFTWQSICAGDLPVATAGWDHIVGMDRRSDTEVVWRFGPRAAGACGLPAATASGLYPPYLLLGPRARLLPRHRLSALPLSAWASDPYFHGPDVVSGPFAYKSAVKDQLLTLVANPRYASGRDHGAYLDQVVYRTYGGKPELLAGLTSGEADVGFHLGSDDIPVLQKLTDSTTIIAPSLQTEFLNPNHATNVQTGRAPPWVGDPRVLDALSLGADRQALDKTVFGGVAEAPPGIYPTSLVAYADRTLASPSSDFAAARQTLEDDGWKAGADGIRSKAGRRLEFALLVTCGNAVRQKEQELLQARWQELGASVRPACLNRSQFLAPFLEHGANATGAFDMSLYSNTWDADPAVWAPFAQSDQVPSAATPDGQNWNRCAAAQLDADFRAGAATLDFAKRRAAYLAAQRVWLAEHCTIPLLQWPRVIQRPFKLHNFAPDPSYSTDAWNAADWWVAA